MKIRNYHRILVTLLLLFSLKIQAQTSKFPNAPGGSYDLTATGGPWNLSSSWGNQGVPGAGDNVRIPAGVTVVVTNLNQAEVRFVRVEGTLAFRPWANTRLTTQTLYIAGSGKLQVGSVAGAIREDRTAEIVFCNSGAAFDTNWDPREQSRGLISNGRIVVRGAPKQHMAECDNSIWSGQTTIDLKQAAPTDWRINDELAIAGTQFKRGTPHSDEIVRFSSASGNLIQLQSSTPTVEKHIRAHGDMNLHIANLTRNVIFRSESASPLKARGHVMFAPGGSVDIQYAAFVDLGRTDKTRPLDEKIITVQGPQRDNFTSIDGDSTNRRGRYACHFHVNGVGPNLGNPPSKVIGCVVRGTPGWGFVNHSSHVLFRENVCYDFKGAGFVTEAGDELGTFDRNIAMHGVGQDRNGDGIAEKYFQIRHVFENPERHQPLGDFGFGGEGFWFQGPAIRAKNNVATNCSGAGMIWFGTGSPEVYSGKYVGFPSSWISGVYPNSSSLVYRTNTDAYQGGNGGNVVISDLPILEMNGLDAYACLVGFKLRFTNHDAVAWYNEGPFDFNRSFVGGKTNLKQRLFYLDLWNNEQGMRARYVSNTDILAARIFNKLRYDVKNKAYSGAELFHSVHDFTLRYLTVNGYGIATHSKPISSTNPGDSVTFIAPVNRINYANAESGKLSTLCPVLQGLNHSAPQANSVTVNWTVNPAHTRYLIRMQRTTDIHWTYADRPAGTGSAVMPGLQPGTTYRYQVLAGCGSSIRFWSAEKQFTTPTNKAETGSRQPEMEGNITLYPNPVSGEALRLQVPGGTQVKSLKVYDLQGRLLLTPEVGPALREGISLAQLPEAGMYLLEVATEAGLQTLRFVKQ